MTRKQSEWWELGFQALAIAVAALVILAMTGCSTAWSKGHGSLLRWEVEVLNAPVTAQTGADYGGKAGPAEEVVRKPLAAPAYPARPNGYAYR